MANITELQFQGDSTVHKLNDARITTTAVTTATHFLATNSGISSIAPITAANLASVLGVPRSDDELLVDLGLPSGNLWATRNVDVTRQNGFAASPYQYECSFFSWGNTFGVNPISSSAFSYNWGTSNSGPYASTSGSSLKADVGLSDDFGRLNLGGEWRLPTKDDFAELFNSSYTKYVDANGDDVTGENKIVTVNGVVGIRLMSLINGKTIFFPCSGNGNDTLWNNFGMYGNYWSSSLYSDTQGVRLHFFSGGVYPQNYAVRFYGFACRPVASKSYKDVYPTLSGMASALGAGFFKKKLYSNGDFNYIKTNAIVSVENCSTNNPSSMKYGVLFCSFDGDTGYQLYIPNSDENNIYIRPYYSGSFHNWRQIPATIL